MDTNGRMTDVDDDFQMKPLTSGLGFQKRPISLQDKVAESGLAQQGLRRRPPEAPPTELLEDKGARGAREIIAELHKALENPSKVKITSTLPRSADEIKAMDVTVDLPPVPEISPLSRVHFQVPEQSIKEQSGVRRGASDNLIPPLTPISVSFTAMALDALIILALSLIFVVSLINVTGINALAVVTSAQAEFTAQLSLVILYLAVFEMYLIVSRSFFGATIGEWTFDLQVGESAQIQKASYPLKVVWRSFLNLMTGLVLLPVFSLLARRDLAGRLSGIRLFRKNN